MNDKYNDHLKQLHDHLVTPHEVIQTVVKEATGKSFKEKRKIIAGESNEVYEVTFDDNDSVIVRISRNGNSVFFREKWAITQAHLLHIPVPHILLIKDFFFDETTYSFCIQERVAGDPLERGDVDYHQLDKGELQQLMNQAGVILSRIHQIPTEGYGYIDENGKGEFTTWKELLSEHFSQEDTYMNLANDTGLGLVHMKSIFKILREESQNDYRVRPVLNHNDFGPKHIMAKDKTVTGIIDWGEAASNSPIYDFLAYSFWYTDIPLEWIKEGYENKTLFDNEFDRILQILSLNKVLGTLWWYHDRKYQYGIDLVIPRILTTLENLR
ncbi:MAG: hypothetical protein QG600_712 [Patescibacteria group bacterium]|jgi:aminoglycoside phosphotransferase (APT) family kinase protein|nr:hypothetical protein [Patescibacteria group bacterium]